MDTNISAFDLNRLYHAVLSAILKIKKSKYPSALPKSTMLPSSPYHLKKQKTKKQKTKQKKNEAEKRSSKGAKQMGEQRKRQSVKKTGDYQTTDQQNILNRAPLLEDSKWELTTLYSEWSQGPLVVPKALKACLGSHPGSSLFYSTSTIILQISPLR